MGRTSRRASDGVPAAFFKLDGSFCIKFIFYFGPSYNCVSFDVVVPCHQRLESAPLRCSVLLTAVFDVGELVQDFLQVETAVGSSHVSESSLLSPDERDGSVFETPRALLQTGEVASLIDLLQGHVLNFLREVISH